MNWQQIKALNEQRGQILADMKTLLDKAEGEKRALTGEENGKFDELRAKAEALKATIDRAEQLRGLAGQPGTDDLEPVMAAKDEKRYSLLRAISLRANNQPLDGLEKEVNDEIAKRSGKAAQGFYFPMQLAGERRDLDTTTGAGAVQKTVDAANFIELLRAKTLTQKLGARILSGMHGEYSVPAQSGGASAYWVTEGNAPTASNQTIGQVALKPSTIGAFTDLTRKFLNQTSLDAEAFVREDLARVLAIAIDSAAYNGSGVGAEPLGILQNTAVTTVEIGENGGAPTIAHVVALETAVAIANADTGTLAYVTNPKVRGKLKVTPKLVSANDFGVYVWGGVGGDNSMNGYSAYASTLIPANLSKGTDRNLSAAIFGNWNDMVISFWGQGVDVMVDPYTLSSTGGVRIVTLADADIKLRHAASFAKIVDIATA